MVSRYGLFVVLGLSLFTPNGYADIYRWVDASGKVHFSDEKPHSTETEKVQVEVNSIEGFEVTAADYLTARARRQVVMYSTAWCGYCRKARQYFRAKDILFTEYDVETTRKGRRDYAKLKGTGVPIIFVGNQRMQGFRAKRFQAIYNAMQAGASRKENMAQ
jgi:glutaredoxin